MEIYKFDDTIIIIYEKINYLYSLINILNYIEKQNSEGSSTIVYLYGDKSLEEISKQYLNVIYTNEKIINIENDEQLRQLIKLEKKLAKLLSFEQYELPNISIYIIYEVCSILEYAHKKHLNVNKIKEKIIEYLENKNKLELSSKVKKIKIYDNN